MYSILLIVIYLAFISLGLPDSLLGSGWPVIHGELGVISSYAGIITMIISGGTILSSLSSDRMTKRFGTGLVTGISVMLTALALFGFSASDNFWQLCLLAIPYGLGAGAVDASINNYVALHYSSRHMNWLHCMWGVGAAISPNIMSFCLTKNFGWNGGYRIVAVIQIVLTVILFITMPLWKKVHSTNEANNEVSTKPLGIAGALKIKGVSFVLLSFFAYCGLEATTILWSSSYLVQHRGVDAVTAASFGALFLIGITIGRFFSGLIADRMGDRRMIRIGGSIVLTGVILVLIPFNTGLPALIGLIAMGLGCAPIYPAIIHSTPANFGKENSQAIVGIQMASAYTGSTFMPPLFGVILNFDIGIFPFFLLFFAVLMILMSEIVNRVLKH
jgi:fucose permease